MVGRGRGRGASLRNNNDNYPRHPSANNNYHPRDYHSRDRDYVDRNYHREASSSTRWLRDPPSTNSSFSTSSVGMGRGRGRGRGMGRGGVIMDNRPAWMTQQEDIQMDQFSRDRAREKHNSNRDRDRDRKTSDKEREQRVHHNHHHYDKAPPKNSESKNEKSRSSSSKKRIVEDLSTKTIPPSEDMNVWNPMDEKKEEEEWKKLLQMSETNDTAEEGNDQDVQLRQFLKSDNDDDEFHESERERKRRERRKRARNSLQHGVKEPLPDETKVETTVDTHDFDRGEIQEMPPESSHTFPSPSSKSPPIDQSQYENDENDNNDNNDDKKDDDDDDDFDMFSDEVVTPPNTISSKAKSITATASAAIRTDDYDDSEGYYKSTIGEIISFPNTNTEQQSFKVLGTLGKGVFSSVLKCVSTRNEEAIIAIKLIRNNETMAKAAQKELRILRLLQTLPNEDSSQPTNHYIVRLIEIPTLDAESYDQSTSSYPKALTSGPLLEYRNHTAIPFEYLPHNLRQILNRFGSGVGINLSAVRSYARQLTNALQHLSRHHIVHADIKPENILVSADYSMVKLADFGSAFFVSDIDARADNPTPYLVSRFYRPPEVILGLEYNHPSVDLWSVGVTLAELFTGSVLFPGYSNNDMIRLFMESMGAFSQKMIKRHIRSYEDRLQLFPFFERDSFAFHRQSIDKVTGQPVVKIVRVIKPAQGRQLSSVMLKSCGTEERVEVLKFADLLSKCLALDPARRVSVEDTCKQPFFVKSSASDKKKKHEEGKQKDGDN